MQFSFKQTYTPFFYVCTFALHANKSYSSINLYLCPILKFFPALRSRTWINLSPWHIQGYTHGTQQSSPQQPACCKISARPKSIGFKSWFLRGYKAHSHDCLLRGYQWSGNEKSVNIFSHAFHAQPKGIAVLFCATDQMIMCQTFPFRAELEDYRGREHHPSPVCFLPKLLKDTTALCTSPLLTQILSKGQPKSTNPCDRTRHYTKIHENKKLYMYMCICICRLKLHQKYYWGKTESVRYKLRKHLSGPVTIHQVPLVVVTEKKLFHVLSICMQTYFLCLSILLYIY